MIACSGGLHEEGRLVRVEPGLVGPRGHTTER